MTSVHAQIIGNNALLPRDELEQLLHLARKVAEVDLCFDEADSEHQSREATTAMRRAAAFRAWTQADRPPTPDLPSEALRREGIYS